MGKAISMAEDNIEKLFVMIGEARRAIAEIRTGVDGMDVKLNGVSNTVTEMQACANDMRTTLAVMQESNDLQRKIFKWILGILAGVIVSGVVGYLTMTLGHKP